MESPQVETSEPLSQVKEIKIKNGAVQYFEDYTRRGIRKIDAVIGGAELYWDAEDYTIEDLNNISKTIKESM